YPFKKSEFDFSGDKLKQKWSELHFDQEPYPSTENIKEMFEKNPGYKEIMEDFDGNYEEIAQNIQQAWRYYHRGEFEKAYHLGNKYYPIGAYVAGRARAVHDFYLVQEQEEKVERFKKHMEKVQELLEEDIEILGHKPKNHNVYFGIAYVIARQAQMSSIISALKHGSGGKIQKYLDRCLENEPDHCEAILTKAACNAEIINKVGSVIGGLTYDVSEEKAKKYYNRVIDNCPGLINGYVEKAYGLLALDREEFREEAIKCLRKARSMQPDDAWERLQQRRAKNMLKDLDALEQRQAEK
ncbi:MAG: hypothetical protein ACOCZ2_05110, partial [Thermodesulfobacteriota bacterium]